MAFMNVVYCYWLTPRLLQNKLPEGQIQDGRWYHFEKLTFEPAHLDSCMKTLFWSIDHKYSNYDIRLTFIHHFETNIEDSCHPVEEQFWLKIWNKINITKLISIAIWTFLVSNEHNYFILIPINKINAYFVTLLKFFCGVTKWLNFMFPGEFQKTNCIVRSPCGCFNRVI